MIKFDRVLIPNELETIFKNHSLATFTRKKNHMGNSEVADE
jgi:hypothetical protein